ncbi:hypothetical protein ACFFU7_03390 [Deinococcus wulumuqiensis]|uniref:Uncharacterized protein n=1 Tax=Deinococcus wulumuqiensis TaxID=980427 RepID=A0AAV4K2Q3_9DEIO|nr:hypothetical protein GCM10010914_01990 [Deinococcus wulumuqiensis]GGP28409.1 hypothetical protein GCM10008021_00600 [Deinococcus wulumuqiensis]
MNEGQKNILVGAAVVLGVLLWQWADGQPPGTALLNAAFFGLYLGALSFPAPALRWGLLFAVALVAALISGLFFNPAGLAPFPALAQALAVTLLLGLIGEVAWRSRKRSLRG